MDSTSGYLRPSIETQEPSAQHRAKRSPTRNTTAKTPHSRPWCGDSLASRHFPLRELGGNLAGPCPSYGSTWSTGGELDELRRLKVGGAGAGARSKLMDRVNRAGGGRGLAEGKWGRLRTLFGGLFLGFVALVGGASQTCSYLACLLVCPAEDTCLVCEVSCANPGIRDVHMYY